MTWKECTLGTLVACTSIGQSLGTIVWNEVPFELVYLDKAHTTAGLLMKPPTGGTFASFSCAGVSKTFTGNGAISKLTAPALNTVSSGFTNSYTASGVVQTYQQIEEAGTRYHLLMSSGGGAPVEGSITTQSINPFSAGETGQFVG